MTRTNRSRSFSVPYPSGSCVSRFSLESQTIIRDNEGSRQIFSMEDSVGRPVQDSGLNFLKSISSSVTGFSGSYSAGGGDQYIEANNYWPPRYRGDIVGYSNSDNPIDPGGRFTHANQVLARSNPNRPSFVLGSLLQDLWDIPHLLRSIGDGLRRGRSPIGLPGVANNALAAKFGWIPLINDVAELLKVFDLVEQRNLELQRLSSSSGLKRRIKLISDARHLQSGVSIDSGFPLDAGGRLSITFNSECWGVVTWKPDNSFPLGKLSSAARISLARRLVAGISASGAFASSWDLIPWSWLLGWVSDVRSYVLAHGNTVPVHTAGPVNLCYQTKQERTVDNVSCHAGLSGGNVKAHYILRLRYLIDGSHPTTYLPHITADRLSTLSLLAVQRLR